MLPAARRGVNVPLWHEQPSITCTGDFFGNPESRALLRTLYDRICRSALGRLKELGFDVSDYQDASGKLAIRADSTSEEGPTPR